MKNKQCPFTPDQLQHLANVLDGQLMQEFPGFKRDELRYWKQYARKLAKNGSFSENIEHRKYDDELKKARVQLNACQNAYITLEKELDALTVIKRTPQILTISPVKSTGGSEATLFMVLSDWHYEEQVDPRVVSGLNEYTVDIAKVRINNAFARGLRFYNMFVRDIPIPTFTLCLLGDFITGSIHDELVEVNQLLPAQAAWEVQNHLISGIQYLLDNTNANFVIPCHSGNHGRMTDKTHFTTEAGNSLEVFMYRNIALYFKGNPRIKFMIAEGYHTYLNVYNKVVRLHHGHAMRYMGGLGGIYIPVNRSIAQWNKGRRADLDVFGHFHQFRDGGNFICNGSLIGYNGYALSIKADFEEPTQSLFLIDNKRGKTIVAPLYVSK